jgi:PAS domain S-box-containing protein/putative nucleotidyltransferase with HDIG domain
MKKTTKNEKSKTGRPSKLLANKKTGASKSQRVEQEIISAKSRNDSELRYRRLFEAAQDGILILDAQTGAIDDVNPYLIDLLGYSRAEFVKRKLWEVGAFKDVDATKIAFNVLQENGYIRYKNLPLRAKSGTLIPVEFVSNVYQAGARQVIQCNIRVTADRTWVDNALRASEKIYRTLFENMLNGVVYCKMIYEQDRPRDFICLDVNSAFESLTGLKDVVGKKASMVIPGVGESYSKLLEVFGRVALTGRSERFETYMEALKMWFSISVFSHEQGYFVAVFDEITERKQAEAELLQSEEFFRLLVKGLRDYAVFMLDPTGHIVSWNTGAEHIKGYRAEEIVGEHFSRFYLDADVRNGKPEQELITARRAGQFREEGWRVRKDGSQFMAEVSITALYDEAGELRGFAKLTRDITERKQAEDALARSGQEYRTLFENMPISLYRTAADGRILDANSAMVRMFGYKDREALLAENITDLYLDPASDRKFKGEMEKTDIISNFEAEFKRPDGKTFWTEDYIRMIRADDGKPMFFEGSLIDITERKQAEKTGRRQFKQLAALREIDRVIASSFDLRYNLTWILEYLTKELGVDAADILILNPVSSRLEYGGGAGFRTRATEKTIMQSGQRHAMRAVLDRQLVYFPNLKDEPNDLLTTKVLADEDFACYYGVPLMAKGSVKGVLEIFQRTSREPDQEWLDFTNSMASQAALAIDNASLFENLQRSNIDLTMAYDATIEGWSRAMDLRDKETEGHTQRVTVMALELAGLFGIKDEELVGIRRGALLHDIGKMGVPDGILLKPSPLTEEEWIIMKKHPALAFEMLSPIHYLQSAIDIPYCHHEKWDGTGYPRGLKGDQIPLAARIFSVVDVWDALTSDRPYREAWSNEKVREYLKSESGKHFDPQVLKICLESGVFDRKDFK